MKIICVTQKPIQTLILIYLLGEKKKFFDSIIYSDIKKNFLNTSNEGKNSWEALKYQCNLLKIHFFKLNNLNNSNFLKKIKADCMISLVNDTIYSEKTISKFKKGIFSFHGGILPKYRGVDCTSWSILNNEKKVGITLHKINKGVDTGKIIYCKKINSNSEKNTKDLDKRLYYTFKLKYFVKLIDNLKNKKKIKFMKNNSIGKQYFSMHKELKEIVSLKLKKKFTK